MTEIFNIIRRNRPNLINQEAAILNNLYSKHVKSKFLKLYPRRIQISKEGRFTVSWRAYITKSKAIDIMVKEYGMLPETWKETRLKKQYEIYRKYRHQKLDKRKIDEIKKQIKSIPRRMPTEWRKRKYEEIFGGIKGRLNNTFE